MPFDAQGYWYPNLSPKQLEIFNCSRRYVLASGPKKSGKTLGNLHRLVKHALETKGARVGMFSKTIKQAKSGGIWDDMTDLIMPEWLEAGVTEYTSQTKARGVGPKQDAQSRMQYFTILNQFGGNSEIQLHSLDNWKDVENVAKSTRFSCFYFAELSAFPDRLVFDITSDQLRIPGLAFKEHLWLADTNPSDEGEDSWIYKLWFKTREKENPSDAEKFLLKHLQLIEVMIEDNPFLSKEDIEDLYARFAHDPDLYARYIEGKWVRATKDAIFRDNFIEAVHKLGDCSSVDEAEWSGILPTPHCREIITGWDLGDRFHSSHIIEPILTEDGRTYCVLDEVCQIDPEVKMGLQEFVEAWMERWEFWLKKLKNAPETRDWADSAALNQWRSGAEGYDANLVYKYSATRVRMMAAPKFPGSIQKRINMVKILLHERRLLVSARCFQTVNMFKSLKRGTGAKLIADGVFRHVFDSLSYPLAGEEPALLVDEVTEDKEEVGRLIRISR
jgi:hypothetical protein